MTNLYTNSNAKKSRHFLIVLFTFMCIIFFEGFRAGLLTHLTGVTPKLFGLITASPIPPQTALIAIMPSSFILFFVFFYFLFQTIFTGVFIDLKFENNMIFARYNGLSSKVLQYNLRDIKKITFQTQSSSFGVSASVVASGTYVVTERLFIHYKSNSKTKKINLVSGNKKNIKELGKKINELKSLIV